MRQRICEIAKDLMKHPTAPYREHWVRQHIIDFCKQRKIAVKQDDVGNLVATYGAAYKNLVFAFAAHMDHPGFIIEADSARNRTTAWFYGGVENKYFKGSPVKIFSADGGVKGVVSKVELDKKLRRRRVWLKLEADVKRGEMGMWDLSACRIRGDRLYSRACDDLAGCVSILALLDALHQRKIRKKVQAVFTVSEESGFQGAKHLMQSKILPKRTKLVAIETSSALPTAKMGDGVVVRVGDASSLFTPGLTAFLLRVGGDLQSNDKTFKYQRKLMDGGTCESTIYNQFGYTNAAVCVPLGNYHNRNVKSGKIAAEFVSISDLENMVKLFLAVVKRSGDVETFLKGKRPEYKRKNGKLGEFFYQ
jgi:endoglucanase